MRIFDPVTSAFLPWYDSLTKIQTFESSFNQHILAMLTAISSAQSNDSNWCNRKKADVLVKGQLISKCPFDVLKSPKKPTKFFVFLVELKTPKGHFKIN